MKIFLIGMVLATFLKNVSAETMPLKACEAIQQNHSVHFEQIDKNIKVSFEEINLIKYSDLETPEEGKFKVSGKLISVMFIESVELSEFLKTSHPAIRILSSIMFKRPEYDGDKDMVSAYAGDFVKAFICK